jgi:general secretion pathway protein F
MALLIGNGVPMLEAMNLAASTAPSGRFRAGLLQARQRVAGGEPLWMALTASDIFPDSILSLVRLGEESNNLGAMMNRAGAMTQAQMRRTVSRVLTFLTPAITILLGALVGSLVVSVMTTLLSINEIAIR